MLARRRALGALLVVSILALAAALRFWGLDFGLPHPLARPDEREIVLPSWGFARGDYNPRYHVYPGLYLYLVWLWGQAGIAIRRLFIDTPPYPMVVMKDIQGLPGGSDGALLLIGRALSALAGTATVAMVYVLGRRRGNRTTGLVAAALLATCFLHVRDSHALKAEALFTLFVLPALASCARFAEQPTAGQAARAGFWIAIATGMKQPGSLLLIPLWVAGMLSSVRTGWRRVLPGAPVIVGALVAVAVFLLTGPYLVLDWPFVWKQMGPSVGTVLAPTGGAPQERALFYHLTMSLRHGAGLLFALLCAPALVLGLRSRDPFWFLLALFTVLWFAVIGVSPVHHVRYLTPALPWLALLIARMLTRAAQPLGRAATAALVAATLLIVAEPLAASIAHDRILARTDTRVLATEWLQEHARPGDQVLVLGTAVLKFRYGQPIMPPGVDFVEPDAPGLDPGKVDWVLTHEHQLPFSRVPAEQLETYRRGLGLESAAEFSPYAGEDPKGWFEAADAYYAPFKDFDGVVRPGPLIRIYAVRGRGGSTRTGPSNVAIGSDAPS